MFNDFRSNLRSVPRQLQNFLGETAEGLGTFARELPGMIPGREIVDAQVDPFTETEPGRFIRSDMVSPTPTPTKSMTNDLFGDLTKGGRGESSGGQQKQQNTKFTIKQPMPDGGTMTINIDKPPETQVSTGTNTAMNYFQGMVPQGQDAMQYFPVLGDQDFMSQLEEADRMRPGLANLLLMQAFNESTLGRTTPNIFGVKPGGNSYRFDNPSAALEYQLGESMLGGGATPNMNILGTTAPITLQDVARLYQSYNPEADYLEGMLNVLGG